MKPSPRTTAFGIAAAVWIGLTVLYITTGFQPDHWISSHGISRQDQSYPGDLVVRFSSISAAEIVVLLLLARPWYFRDLPWRLLVSFIIFSTWTIAWVLAQLHQPPVQGVHAASLLALVPILLVALIWVSVVTWVRDRRTRSPGERTGEDAPVAAGGASRVHAQEPTSADRAPMLENARAELVSPLQDTCIYLNPAEVPSDITYPSGWNGPGLYLSPNGEAARTVTAGNTTVFMGEEGHWRVSSPLNTYSLISADDFVRALILLEQPLRDVEAILGPDFPYIQTITAGLQCESDYWTALALGWVADSPSDAYDKVRDHLRTVSMSSSLSQKNRQAAFRLIRQRDGQATDSGIAPQAESPV